MKKIKKIFLVTSNRSEYGIMRNLIKDFKKSKKLRLYLIATGSHLNSFFGYTIKEIIDDKNKIFKKIKINSFENGLEKNFFQSSKIITQFSNLFLKFRPDLLLILGDRYEIFSVAAAAVFNNIPIAHLHGGEKTEGSMDDIFRNSITKMSNYHFVATKNSKKRVIQLGENPQNTFFVGSLGVENIKKIKILGKQELKQNLSINFNKKNIMLSFHPEREISDTKKNLIAIIQSLKSVKNTNIFMSMPNPDKGNQIIFKLIKNVLKNNKNFYLIKSMGSQNFLSMLKYMNLIIGNSSSGIIEAPSIGIPTLNIGNRQKGREQSKSIYNCQGEKKEIQRFLLKILKKNKKNINFSNPYEKKNTSKNIIKVLEKVNYKGILNKEFYDL